MKIYIVQDDEYGIKVFTNRHEADNLACSLRCELVHLYEYSLDDAEQYVKVYEYDLNVSEHILKEELNNKQVKTEVNEK